VSQDQQFIIEILKLVVPVLLSAITGVIALLTFRRVGDVHHEMNSMKDQLVLAEKGKSFLEGQADARPPKIS
jgi:hypothetical protein